MDRRTELVSQWQDRLTSAEQLADGTAQFRWIHLARVRLYRFLLACYGSGLWREDVRENGGLPPATAELDFPLEGKPPKSAGAIQSVLKAVHTAQDHPPPAGPLTGGLDPESYMAVTDSNARIDVARCEQFLSDNGFHPRVVGRGRRMTVEVPYCELRQAEALVDGNRQALRPPRATTTLAKIWQKHPLPEESQIVLIGLFLIAPVIGLTIFGIGLTVIQNQLVEVAPGALFGLVLGAIFSALLATLLWYVAARRWMTTMSLASRRKTAMAVICICIGAPAAVLLSAASYANPPALQSLASPPAIVAILLTLAVFIAIFWEELVRRR